MRRALSSGRSLLAIAAFAWVVASCGDADEARSRSSARGLSLFPSPARSTWADVRRTGLDAEAAGFHLLPPRNIDHPPWHLASASGPFSFTVGRRRFWFAETHDPASHAGPFGVPQPLAWCSIDRIWANDAVELRKVGDGTAWSLSMTFTERGRAMVLSHDRESAADEPYLDWFDRSRAAGEPATELRVALVARRTAFRPVSVSDMVAAGGPWTATVATGLTEAEADEIIALFASS